MLSSVAIRPKPLIVTRIGPPPGRSAPRIAPSPDVHRVGAHLDVMEDIVYAYVVEFIIRIFGTMQRRINLDAGIGVCVFPYACVAVSD